MITHCTQCDIHWATLWTGDGDQAVEFCPECSTDSFLEESKDFVGYIKCPITGRISNVFTGETLSKEINDARELEKPRIRVVVGKPDRETTEEREARELSAIEAYQASGSKNDYHSTIKKHK